MVILPLPVPLENTTVRGLSLIHISGKTVKLPDQHNVKQLFVAVFYHLLKLRAVVRFGRDGTVSYTHLDVYKRQVLGGIA